MMIQKFNYAKALCCLPLLGASYAGAFEFSPTIDIHGFGTLGASMTNATNVDIINPFSKQVQSAIPLIDGIGNTPTFNEDIIGGVRFTAALNSQFFFVTQFFSEGAQNYRVRDDFAFAQWNVNEDWSLKMGRMRLPIYMFSEDIKVRYAYPWARPPIEFYNIFAFEDFTGLIIRNKQPLIGSWVNQITAGFGTAEEIDENFALMSVNAENTFLAEWIIFNENVKLRAGYVLASLNPVYPGEILTLQTVLGNPCGAFNSALAPEILTMAAAFSPGDCVMTLSPSIPLPLPFTLSGFSPDNWLAHELTTKNASASFLSFGYDVNWQNFISIAEWRNIHIDDRILPAQTSWYVLLGYVWDNVTFHATYANTRTTNNSDRTFYNTLAGAYVNPFSLVGPQPLPQPETMLDTVNTALHQYFDIAQEGIDVGIRYDFMPNMALKVDYQYLNTDNNTRGFFLTEYGPAAPGKRISWVTAEIDVVF